LVFAIVSALLLGSNKLAVRMSLFSMDESFASLIAILLAIPLFGFPLLVYGWGARGPTLDVVIILGLAGILNFSLGRYFIWKSIANIGANRGNIFASSQVVYAVLIAILFLNQTVNLNSGVGIVLVMLGILLVSIRGLSGTPFTQKQLKLGIASGIFGGFLWGISQVLMQIGISEYANPLGAAFITYLASVAGVIPVILVANRYSAVRESKSVFRFDWRGFAFVLVAALFGNFGLFFRYAALQTIPLTIVATVNGTNPMITLILSYFLIKDVEFIDGRTILGIASSVLGITIMSI